MQKPILEHAQGEENEVVLLVNPSGTTCSGNNGYTHDGNEYAKRLTYHCLLPALSHLISESFGKRSSIGTNELVEKSDKGFPFNSP